MPIDFAYAQARAQARQASRLPPSRWRAIESSADLNRYIHGLRGTPLASVVQHFTATASPHAIELALRRFWHAEVESTSLWVPQPWRESVAWTTWLPELDAIAFLLEGNHPQPWMHEDDVLSRFAFEDGDERRAAIEAQLGSLPPATDFVPGRWWYERWLTSLPTTTLTGTGLDELTRLLGDFVRTGWGSVSPSAPATDKLEMLGRQFVRLLHRRTGTPAAAYCHLALIALDLMRLRGSLVRLSLVNAGATGSRP
jgi:hypothetical protein